MSFHSLLKHRVDVYTLTEQVHDGASTYVWSPVRSELRCYLDLPGLAGRDPYFTPEGGRPSERAGRVFVLPMADGKSPIKAGDHLVMTRGPSGTFKVENIIDEVWTPKRLHHWEYGVTEVAPQVARAQVTQASN